MKERLAKTLYSLVALLPNAWSQRLGDFIGSLLYRFNNRERYVVNVNIALCFPELSEQAQQALVKNALQENAKILFELPRIFKKGRQFAIDLITEVQGIEHYQHAIATNRGVILLAPHLGNWELTVNYLNQFSTITAMYDPPKQAFLSDLVKNARQDAGVTLFPADGTGVRAQLKHLKQGGVAGILPDQVPGHDNAGVYAPFMGQTAFTMTLVNNFAKRSGAKVVMAFAERLSIGKGYKLHIIPAPEGIADDDAISAATALNQGIEQCVRIDPAQYQWTYKRFKHQRHNENLYQ